MFFSYNKKGFTLVEVLIVVFIIGLLSSIVLIGLGSFRARGRDARRIADLHQIRNGLELYISKEGTYPDVDASNASGWQAFGNLLKNAGIGVNIIPNDPAATAANGRSYFYNASADLLSYVLGARLEEGEDPVLDSDVDAVDFNTGFDCADPVYCIQL